MVKNPFSGENEGEYLFQSFKDASEGIKLAQRSFAAWSRRPLPDRIRLLTESMQYFRKHEEQVAQDITRQMGKPISQARSEIHSMFQRFEMLCIMAPDALAPFKPSAQAGFTRRIEHVPLGVVYIISPWNYPLLTAINGIVTSLLAGNTVVLKHSPQTPEVGEHFARAFKGLGEGVFQHIFVDHNTADELIQSEAMNHVIFTGSVKGGKEISKALSHRFISSNLELGGKDAAYIAEDANIETAVSGVVEGAMYNAGQSCCGLERAFVHKKVAERFLVLAEAACKEWNVGNPTLDETNLGPLTLSQNLDLIEAQVNEALQGGAKLHCGGKQIQISQGNFFPATLLSNVQSSMRIMQEENFGPILPVMIVEDDTEAIQKINDSNYGLSAAIYTSSSQRAEAIAQQLEVGTVFMNRCDFLDPELAWTGVKQSGRGCSLSPFGFYEVTRKKSIHFREAN